MSKPAVRINEVIKITYSELDFKITEILNGIFKEFRAIIVSRLLADN